MRAYDEERDPVRRLSRTPNGFLDPTVEHGQSVRAFDTPRVASVAAQESAAPIPEAPAPETVTPMAPRMEPLPEPKRRSAISKILDFVPALAMGAAHLGGQGSAETRQRGYGMLSQAAEQSEADRQRYEQAKRAVAKNRQELAAADFARKRQAGLDAQGAEAHGVNMQKARGDMAAMEERRNPNSASNKRLRDSLEARYTGIRDALGDRFETITLENAETLEPIINGLQRGEKNDDRMKEIEHQQRMELQYNTNLPGGGFYGYNPGPAAGGRGALSVMAQIFPAGIPPAYQARAQQIEEAASAGRKDVPQLYAALLEDAHKESAALKLRDQAETPPTGFVVGETPGDKASWQRAQRDGGAREAARIATRSVTNIRNSLARMKELRQKHGTEWFDSDAKGEFEGLRTGIIGEANRLVLDAGVLNPSEAATWNQKLKDLGPHVQDFIPGAPDPVMSTLDGFEKAIAQQATNNLGVQFGLHQVGRSSGQQDIAQGNTGVKGVTPGQGGGGASGKVKIRNPDTGEVKEVSPQVADVATRERGWQRAQ